MTQRNSRLILGLGIISLLTCIILNISSEIFLGIIILWILIVLLLISIESALFALIFIRPSIDILSPYSLPDFPMINLGSTIGSITILLSSMYIYKKRAILYNSRIPLLWSLAIIIIVYIVLSFTGVSIATGLQETVRLITFIMLYFVGWIYVSTQDKLINIVRVIIYASIIPLISSYIQYFSGSGLYTNPGFENRIAGTFGHPNVLAYFSVIVLTLIVSIWRNKSTNIVVEEKRLFMGIGLLYVIVLLITFTRGAWLGLVLGALIIGLIQYPRKSLIITSIGLGFITLSLFVYQVLSPPTVLDLPPLTTLPIINRVSGLFTSDPSDSIIWRLTMWRDMYKQAWQSPIIGFGTGSSQIMVEQTRGIFRGSLEVHNDYIKIFLEQGFIGLIAYGILILNILGVLYYRYIQGKNIYILYLASLMTVIYIVSFWDNLLRGTVLMWILFLLLGAVLHYQSLLNKSDTSI
jgi:O-antigen ligase